MSDKIKALKKEAKLAPNLPEKLKHQKEVKRLESRRDEEWMKFKEVSKEIETKKDELIDEIEKRLKQKVSIENLFTITWKAA